MLPLIFNCAGEVKKEIFMPCYQGIKGRGFFCLDNIGEAGASRGIKYQIEYKSKKLRKNRERSATLKGGQQESNRLFSWKALNRVTSSCSFKPTFVGTFVASHHKWLIYKEYN